jgi:diamine N-acetyltransferase
MKRNILPIQYESVLLRPLEYSDLPLTLSWRNLDHIRIWFFHSEIITLQDHKEWFNRYSELDNDFIFMILYEQKPVGQISLYNIDWEGKNGEYGRLMIGDASARGKNIARTATNLMINLAFDTFKLEEVHLFVKKENVAAIVVYLRCGFIIKDCHDDEIYMVNKRGDTLTL